MYLPATTPAILPAIGIAVTTAPAAAASPLPPRSFAISNPLRAAPAAAPATAPPALTGGLEPCDGNDGFPYPSKRPPPLAKLPAPGDENVPPPYEDEPPTVYPPLLLRWPPPAPNDCGGAGPASLPKPSIRLEAGTFCTVPSVSKIAVMTCGTAAQAPSAHGSSTIMPAAHAADLLCCFAHHSIGCVAKCRVRVTAEVQRGTDRVRSALQLALKVGRAPLRDLQHHSERL